MTTYNVFANGTLWDTVEASDEAEAILLVANKHGTIDIGSDSASTSGMTAKPVVLTLNEKGLASLRAVLDANGKGGDILGAWASVVEEAINSRVEGESLSVELDGIRTTQGHPVHFTPAQDEIYRA